MSDELIILDTPDQIEAYRLLAIKSRLKLELLGMRFKDGSTFAYVKRTYGFKGNRQKVYDQYVSMLKEKGVLTDGD